MTFDLLIKNATVLDPSRDIHEKKDIGVASGKIRSIENSIPDSNIPFTELIRHKFFMGKLTSD